MGKLVIAYIGNTRPSHSTENHVSASLRAIGCHVKNLQEDEVRLPDVLEACRGVDLLLWTKTGQWLKCNGFEMLKRARVPSVGLHLDLWHGLEREDEVKTSPFFSCDYVMTADGNSDEWFKEQGVNHFWLKPGVLKQECYVAEPRPDLACDVGFIGSYGYHSSHPRKKLIDWLSGTYRDRFRLFGAQGDSWRGHDLNQLYRSIKVAVGDSCSVNGKLRNYCSDRTPESLGRGGCNAMPAIEGITEEFTNGVECRLFDFGDYDCLKRTIDEMLAMTDEQRLAMRKAAVAKALSGWTYEHRMKEMLATVAKFEPSIAERLSA